MTDIDLVIERFDFEKVAKVMASLGWTYWHTAPNTPTETELIETARQLLNNLDASPQTLSTGSGGFVASRHEGEAGPYLQLDFVVETADIEYPK